MKETCSSTDTMSTLNCIQCALCLADKGMKQLHPSHPDNGQQQSYCTSCMAKSSRHAQPLRKHPQPSYYY